MRAVHTIVWVVLLAGFALPARAQTASAPPLAPLPARSFPLQTPQLAPSLDLPEAAAAERAAELKQWVDDFTKWLEWSQAWSNRRERGWFTSSRDRREKPAPPEWLPARCATVFDDDDPLSPACELLAEWQNEGAAQRIRMARKAASIDAEKSNKTIWWEHIHADLLWPAMQVQSSVYGVVGMHTAMTVKGRFEIFLAPGAMLLNLPSRYGTRVWKIATNYGIGYRLADFTFFGGRPASLHVNLAKAWLLSDVADVVAGRATDFAGLSISFKRSR